MSGRSFPLRLALALGAAAAVVALDATGAFARFELPIRDLMLRLRRERPARAVAAIVIDEDALGAYGPWPWPRQRIAALLDGAKSMGARAVVLDVLLPEARPGDEALAAALAGIPTALVAAPADAGNRWLLPPAPLRSAARLGHGVFELDHDGVLRRLMSTKQAGGLALPALAFTGAALLSPRLTIPVAHPVVPGFRTAPAAVPTIGAARVLRGDGGAEIRGRLVFVGLTAAGLGDRVMTPATRGPRPDPGVLVQAAVAEALVTGDLLHRLPPWLAAVPAFLLVLLVGAVARLGGVRRLAGHAALLVAPTVLGGVAITAGSLTIPTVTLTVLVVAAVLIVETRLALLAWRRSGETAALLTAASGSAPSPSGGSLEGRLDLVGELATAAARRRLAEEESRGVVIHELKTPLTSVRGLSQMLRDMDLSPDEQHHAAGLLASEAERLEAMVGQLLDLERLPRRDRASGAEMVDLSALLAARAEVLAQGHGRRVETRIEPDLAVLGDRRLLERVVDNLVGNAFKFSPERSTVTVTAMRVGDHVEFAVRDEGVGIAPEERQTIFRRFSRGRSAAGRPGLGLGLALVAEVVTWHGGRVEVTGAPAAGSVFTVTLPAARKEP